MGNSIVVRRREPADDLDVMSERASARSMRKVSWPTLKSFAQHVAAAALVRALRPYPGWQDIERDIVVGIVVPEEWHDPFLETLESFLRGGASFGYSAEIVSLHREKVGRSDVKDSLGKCRVFVMATDSEQFPDEMHVVADGLVEIGAVGPRHVQAAAHRHLGISVPLADAERIAVAPVSRLAAFRRGRRLKDSMLRLGASVREEAQPVARQTDALPTLDDLHGLGEAGEWGRELATDLADWRDGRIAWADVDRGILLSGPPGTGKTTFAGALARSCGAHFVSGSYAQWQAAGHLGDMLKAMRKAFAEARAKAPSILFIDEIDSFGSRVTGDDHDRDYANKVISGFLQELDGAEAREGVVVVGAANHPEALDPAIIRPGRLDRHVRIPLPDACGREGVLRWHLHGALASEDLSGVASRTEGWSGAALEQLVRQARRTARRARRALVLDDLVGELPALVPVPPHMLWRSSVHEAGHAVVGHVLGRWRVLHAHVARAYVPAAQVLAGGVRFEEDGGRQSTAAAYHDNIVRALGGTAAEEVVLGDRADGAGGSDASDLATATRYATILEASVGLGQELSYLGRYDGEVEHLVRSDYLLRQRVDDVLAECLERARVIVREHRDDVERLAVALRDRGSLSGDEVREVLEGQPRLQLVG